MSRGTRVGSAAVVLALAWPAEEAAADLAKAQALVDGAIQAVIELRHEIHRNPELGNREFETAALVAEELREAGLEVTEGVARTGVVALLRGGRPGPVVAVRADMDALPVTEATDLPFRSTKMGEYLGQKTGLAHACGHDVHTAVVLGAAKVLSAMRAEVSGTVLFIFQPAEEGPPPGEKGGASLVLEEGIFTSLRPEAIFGLHAWPGMSVGEVGIMEGAMMAAVDHFALTIEGRQTHGAMPHLGVDPIVMAAQVIQGLQTIRSRSLSPLEPSVVTVGIVRGGKRFNIIPAQVHLEGTVRTFSVEARNQVRRRVEEIVKGITAAGGGSYEITRYESKTPPLVNDSELVRRGRLALEAALGQENVVEVLPSTGGEDFAYFANEVPGLYFRLGIEKPGLPSGALHTPTFRADDDSIEVGIRAMIALVRSELTRGP